MSFTDLSNDWCACPADDGILSQRSAWTGCPLSAPIAAEFEAGCDFFGESIPEPAGSLSLEETRQADCFILIGTTGTVAPANLIPSAAKSNGAVIIEINPVPSDYTRQVTDIFLETGATKAMTRLMDKIACSSR